MAASSPGPARFRGPWNVRRAVRVLAPLAVIVAVAVLDATSPRTTVLLGLVATAPLLAANLVGVELTAAYGVLATVVAVLLGVNDHLYGGHEAREAQLIRITAVLISSVAGVLGAHRRVVRERHLQQVSRVAEVAQQAVLAPIPPRLGGLALAVRYTSAAVDARIGGDLYAAVETPYGVRLLIGDVRGKGLDAVRLASHLLGAFRERAYERADLGVLLADLDRSVCRVADDEDFVTAVLAEVTPAGHLTVVNAGHPAPLLLREGVAVVLRPPERRPPLGLPGTSAPLGIDLRVGDRLLLYTDGLGEARHRSDRTFFPLRQYAAPALASGSLEEGLTGVQHAVRDWTGGSLSDDVALMAVEVLSVVPDPSAEAEHEPPATT